MSTRHARQLLFWFAFCAASTPRAWLQPPVRALAHAIVGGYPRLDSAASATALIDDCDATLVAHDLLLTAAHCVVDHTPAQAWFGRSLDEAVTSAEVAYCEAHPDYPLVDGTDIAYCVLSESVTDVEPALLEADCNRAVTEVAGAELVLRGHGYTTAARQEERIERSVEVHVDSIQAEGFELVVGDREHGACNGDSGGSAYRTLPDDELVLVGVISRRGPAEDGEVANNCESTTIVTRVAPYLSWITASTGAVLSTSCASLPPTAAAATASDEVITPFGATTTPDASAPPTRGCTLAPRAAHPSSSLYAWVCAALLCLRRRVSQRCRRRGAGDRRRPLCPLLSAVADSQLEHE